MKKKVLTHHKVKEVMGEISVEMTTTTTTEIESHIKIKEETEVAEEVMMMTGEIETNVDRDLTPLTPVGQMTHTIGIKTVEEVENMTVEVHITVGLRTKKFQDRIMKQRNIVHGVELI